MKELVVKGYLCIYNVVQGLIFFYITLSILMKLLLNGAGILTFIIILGIIIFIIKFSDLNV